MFFYLTKLLTVLIPSIWCPRVYGVYQSEHEICIAGIFPVFLLWFLGIWERSKICYKVRELASSCPLWVSHPSTRFLLLSPQAIQWRPNLYAQPSPTVFPWEAFLAVPAHSGLCGHTINANYQSPFLKCSSNPTCPQPPFFPDLSAPYPITP